MESTKREFSEADVPVSTKKKARINEAEPSEPPKLNQRVVLNPADCDLDFDIEGNGLQGSALHGHGFAYCWSGARANVGITGGKYCFGCKIISAQPVNMEDTPLDQQHVCRLGISRGDDNVGSLGESVYSFGFGGTGKFSNAGKFSDYGEKYGIGDTIVCAVDLENEPLASVGFSKNGKWLGVRYFNAGPYGLGILDSPIRELQWESAVFPHVLLKNLVVQLQFSTDDGLIPEEGYKPWASALEEGNVLIGPGFGKHQDCEVIMLVGLPASGKSTWAEKWVKEHPEKRYVLLGTNLALDQMKVPGLLRKHNYGERFDLLMDRATGIFNTLLSRASKIPRNFILDQTNVYKNARKRKLKPFANYKKIAVVVFPKPDELKVRAEKRFKEMGKEVPAEAVNEMLANYVLPTSKDMPGTDEFFDQVIFPELGRMESQRHLNEMKTTLATKSDFSPCPQKSSVQSYDNTLMQNSRESSIQSYNNPSLQYQGSLSVASGQWQSSYPPPPLLSSYAPQPLLSSPYGNHSRPSGFLPNRSYCGYDHPGSGIESRTSTPGGFTDSCGTYGMGNIYRGATDPNHCRVVEPYARTSSFAYNTGGNTSVPGSLQAPGQPTFQAGTPAPYGKPTTYGMGDNYNGGHTSGPRSLQADLPAPVQPTFLAGTPYGSSYGTPTPRPSYGDFPSHLQHSGGYVPSIQHSGGYVPPNPRYY